MNKRNSIFLVLFLALNASTVLAAETAGIPSVGLAQPSQAPSSNIPFSTIVTADGRLITKPGHVFTQGGHYEGMALPYLLSTPKPIRYPHWAIREGWEGDFVIAIEVRKDGSVGRYKVMKSTGHQRLDNAVISAMKSWKFHPAEKDGKVIVTCVELPVRFELQA